MFFKLKNGEEFIAELLHERYSRYEIKQPVVLTMGNSSAEANFILWCPLRKNREFEIQYEDVLFTGDVDQAVQNEYERLFNNHRIIQPQMLNENGVASIRSSAKSYISQN